MLEGVHHVLHDMDRSKLDQYLRAVMKALEDMEPSLEAPVAARKALDVLERQA